MGTPLACPNCGTTDLWSDEPASIMYTVQLTRSESGDVEVEYTGTGYEPQDEGTEYAGDIWCRQCGTQHTEAALVPESTPCTECQEVPATEYGMCDSCIHDATRSGWVPGT